MRSLPNNHVDSFPKYFSGLFNCTKAIDFDPGKNSCTNLKEATTYLLLNGRYTQFCNYKTVTQERYKWCRTYGYVNEILPHVVNYGNINSAVTFILARRLRLLPVVVLDTNRQVRRIIRPSLVVLDKTSKEVKIIDKLILFECEPNALYISRQRKIGKCNNFTAE